jgi:hypothetical protein
MVPNMDSDIERNVTVLQKNVTTVVRTYVLMNGHDIANVGRTSGLR